MGIQPWKVSPGYNIVERPMENRGFSFWLFLYHHLENGWGDSFAEELSYLIFACQLGIPIWDITQVNSQSLAFVETAGWCSSRILRVPRHTRHPLLRASPSPPWNKAPGRATNWPPIMFWGQPPICCLKGPIAGKAAVHISKSLGSSFKGNPSVIPSIKYWFLLPNVPPFHSGMLNLSKLKTNRMEQMMLEYWLTYVPTVCRKPETGIIADIT